jgi:hypothetical protein
MSFDISLSTNRLGSWKDFPISLFLHTGICYNAGTDWVRAQTEEDLNVFPTSALAFDTVILSW